jgi:ferric-dicitrate binding protein FerR (iron transport regulator)
VSQDDELTQRQRTAEAARWFVEHEAGDQLDETRLVAWDEFLSDPHNRTAYASVVEWHQAANALSRPQEPTAHELLQDLATVSPRISLTEIARQNMRRPLPWRKRVPRTIGWVAGLVVTLGLSLYARQVMLEGLGATEHVYSTAAGEQRYLVLEDGSEVTLGGDTSLTVRFTHASRLLVLRRGEGLFRVQHDRERPFSVCARSACVTAIGTAFDVHLYKSHVQVWVQTGVVDVRQSSGRATNPVAASNRDSPHWEPVRLHQGQALSYDYRHGPGERTIVDSQTAAAWTTGSLIYYGQPLADVVEDVQRYSSLQVVLDNNAAGLLYSGSVLQTSVDHFIKGLPEIFPVAILDCANNQIDPASGRARWCATHPDSILIGLQ